MENITTLINSKTSVQKHSRDNFEAKIALSQSNRLDNIDRPWKLINQLIIQKRQQSTLSSTVSNHLWSSNIRILLSEIKYEDSLKEYVNTLLRVCIEI